MRYALTLIVLCFNALMLSAGENWPQFRGPSGDGLSDARDLPTTWSEKENIRWKTPIHDKGWSSPVVWGDQIWMTTAFEKYTDPKPKENTGKQEPRPLYVDFYAVCVDRKSGKITHDVKVFTQEKPAYCIEYNSYATPTPVVEEGRVFVHFGSHGTACLDTSNGQVLWKRQDLPCDHWRGPASSPIVYENWLILTFDGHDQQYVAALDKKTGTTAWKKDRHISYSSKNGDLHKAYSTPAILMLGGKPQLISPAAEATIAYNPSNGDELWRIHHGGMNESARPLFGHGMIYLNNGHRQTLLAVKQGGSGMLARRRHYLEDEQGSTQPAVVPADRRIYLHGQRQRVCFLCPGENRRASLVRTAGGSVFRLTGLGQWIHLYVGSRDTGENPRFGGWHHSEGRSSKQAGRWLHGLAGHCGRCHFSENEEEFILHCQQEITLVLICNGRKAGSRPKSSWRHVRRVAVRVEEWGRISFRQEGANDDGYAAGAATETL